MNELFIEELKNRPDFKTIFQEDPSGKLSVEANSNQFEKMDKQAGNGADSTMTTLAFPEGGSMQKPDITTLAFPEGGSMQKPDITTLAFPEGGSMQKPDITTLAFPEGGSMQKPDITTLAFPEGGSIQKPAELEIPSLKALTTDTTSRELTSSRGGDKVKEGEVVHLSNGDTITIGGSKRFQIIDADGKEVEKVSASSGAFDAPTRYILSNGAIYKTRGGWNHNESITYPNGDKIEFTDSGKLTKTTIDGVTRTY